MNQYERQARVGELCAQAHEGEVFMQFILGVVFFVFVVGVLDASIPWPSDPPRVRR
jgi:hypothetical protein